MWWLMSHGSGSERCPAHSAPKTVSETNKSSFNRDHFRARYGDIFLFSCQISHTIGQRDWNKLLVPLERYQFGLCFAVLGPLIMATYHNHLNAISLGCVLPSWVQWSWLHTITSRSCGCVYCASDTTRSLLPHKLGSLVPRSRRNVLITASPSPLDINVGS